MYQYEGVDRQAGKVSESLLVGGAEIRYKHGNRAVAGANSSCHPAQGLIA
jgi:hypothetical protein